MGFQNLWVLSLWVASGITLFPYSDSWEQEVLGRVLSRYPFLMSWNYLSLCKTVFSTLLSNHPKQPLGNSLWTRTAWSDLVKLWVFFAYGVFCRLVPIYLTFCVWVLEVFCLWPPKYPGFFFFLAFLPFLSGAPSQYNISEECPVLGCDQDADMSTTAGLSFPFAALAEIAPVGNTAASWLLVMSLEFSSVPSGDGNFVYINRHGLTGFTGTKRKSK